MRTAVDTVVLLDVFGKDPRHWERSRDALVRQYAEGALVACEVVFAETRAHFNSGADFRAAISGLGLAFEPLDAECAELAGEMWASHRRSRGKRDRVVADFLVGAHAALRADALLTRDRGFYRASFRPVRILEP